MSPTEEGELTASQYDAMAAPYAACNRVNAANAYYERPATKAMLGEVRGARLLEIGCGAGELTDFLVSAGARVTAVDVSAGMLALAREKLGGKAELLQADLHDGLFFLADGEVDLVVASLVLHYLEDWEPVLDEVHRVLRPGGHFVFSTHHPTWDGRNHSPGDYFKKLQVTEEWSRGGGLFPVTFWRRPLREMTRAIARAGFVIEQLDEPEPLAELQEVDAASYEELCRFPFFLLFRLRKQVPPAEPRGQLRPGAAR